MYHVWYEDRVGINHGTLEKYDKEKNLAIVMVDPIYQYTVEIRADKVFIGKGDTNVIGTS